MQLSDLPGDFYFCVNSDISAPPEISIIVLVLVFVLLLTLGFAYEHTALTSCFASLFVKHYYFFARVDVLITCKLLQDSQK